MAKLKNFDPTAPLTPEGLYRIAKQMGVERERLRICDGMAVSYFPTCDAVCFAKDKIVIDVSAEPSFDYDELAANDRVILYSVRGGWISVPDAPDIDCE